jgi:hypothetical protein
MLLIVVRGANGVATWSKQLIDRHSWNWVCGRDQFAVPGPTDPSLADTAAAAIATHSASLVGAISQVVQIDL